MFPAPDQGDVLAETLGVVAHRPHVTPMANCGPRKSIYGAYEFPKTDGSGLDRVPGNILDWFEISDAQLEIPRLGDNANLVDRHGVESISC